MNWKQLFGGKISPLILLITFSLLVIALGSAGGVKARASWQQKVDPWVMDETAGQAEAEFLIVLDQQADLSAAAKMSNKLQKGRYVYQQLTAVARQTQPPLLDALQQTGAAYQSFWVSNMIWVRGDAAVVEAMARRPDVAQIYANPKVQLDVINPFLSRQADAGPDGVEWNIDLGKRSGSMGCRNFGSGGSHWRTGYRL